MMYTDTSFWCLSHLTWTDKFHFIDHNKPWSVIMRSSPCISLYPSYMLSTVIICPCLDMVSSLLWQLLMTLELASFSRAEVLLFTQSSTKPLCFDRLKEKYWRPSWHRLTRWIHYYQICWAAVGKIKNKCNVRCVLYLAAGNQFRHSLMKLSRIYPEIQIFWKYWISSLDTNIYR